MSVLVLDPERRLGEPAAAWLRAAAEDLGAALHESEGARGELRVRLVGDAEMAAAHARHKGVEGTTDVLTFDLSEPPGGTGGSVMDVDVLACVDEARRQAGERGIAPERELLLYIVHGALHCLGYDDATEQEGRAMHAREDQLLEHIGVGATYGAARAEPLAFGRLNASPSHEGVRA